MRPSNSSGALASFLADVGCAGLVLWVIGVAIGAVVLLVVLRAWKSDLFPNSWRETLIWSLCFSVLVCLTTYGTFLFSRGAEQFTTYLVVLTCLSTIAGLGSLKLLPESSPPGRIRNTLGALSMVMSVLLAIAAVFSLL